MLEIAILTCVEASKVINNISKNTSLSAEVRLELIQTVLDRSDCNDGTIR